MNLRFKIYLLTSLIALIMIFSLFNVNHVSAKPEASSNTIVPSQCSPLVDTISTTYIMVATNNGYNNTPGLAIHVSQRECFGIIVVNERNSTDNFTVDEIGGGLNNTLDAPPTGIDAVFISSAAGQTSLPFYVRAPQANMKVEFYSAGHNTTEYGYFIIGNATAPGFEVGPVFVAFISAAMVVTGIKKKKRKNY